MNRPALHSILLAAIACALVVAAGAVPAFGQSIGELESRIGSAQTEARGLAAEIESQGAALAAAQSKAIAAASREAELSGTLAAGQERSAELAGEVDRARAALVEARKRLRRSLDALAERLVAIYKGDVPDATTLILQAEGFDDLATRTEYLRAIEEADAALAERVRALRAEVATRLDAVEQARQEQEAFNERVADARDEIAAARAAAEAQAGELAAARAAQRSALSELRSRVGEWTSRVQALRSTSAAQARQEVADWVGDFAIPAGIVICESGGSYDAVNPSSGAGGAYQIIPSTWKLYGGKGSPQDASPAEQDRIAAQIWADSGSSAWACAG